jgi:hypothetical protein
MNGDLQFARKRAVSARAESVINDGSMPSSATDANFVTGPRVRHWSKWIARRQDYFAATQHFWFPASGWQPI